MVGSSENIFHRRISTRKAEGKEKRHPSIWFAGAVYLFLPALEDISKYDLRLSCLRAKNKIIRVSAEPRWPTRLHLTTPNSISSELYGSTTEVEKN